MSAGIATIVRCGSSVRLVVPTLRSIAAQRGGSSAVLLLTDASATPAMREWVASLAARDGLRHVHAETMAPGAARNAAVHACTQDLVHFLDAGDWIEPSFLDECHSLLSREPSVPFVTTGLTFVGPGTQRSTAVPAAADLNTLLGNSRTIHNATMFRRSAWHDAGEFDEQLAVLDELDLWLKLAAAKGAGAVVREALVVRPVRREPLFPREADADLRRIALAVIVERHSQHTDTDPAVVLFAAEERLRRTGARYAAALQQRDEAVTEITRLEAQAVALAAETPGAFDLDLGELHRVTPLSRDWGYERGGPVDRYYIEEFLSRHASDVAGAVLEVQEPDYSQRFGGNRVTRSDVVDADAANPRATIVSDLRAATNIPSATYDCIIITQTIHVIDDMAAVVAECHRILKPGGVLLATLPAASRVCVEYGQDGDFWRVTEAGARRLFSQAFRHDHLEIASHGNVLVNTAFLYGLGAPELTAEQYAFSDPYYPALISVRAVKSDGAGLRPRESSTGAAILVYHRVATLDRDPHRLAVPPGEFRRQMEWLREHCKVVTLTALSDAVAAGSVEPGTVAITFDDGYLDNLETASPILTELGLPATFFFTTEGLDDDAPYEFWWDRLERLLLAGEAPRELTIEISGERRPFATATGTDRLNAHWRIYEAIVTAPAGVRDAVIAQVAAWRPDSRMDPRDRRMTRAEMTEIASRPGHAIGAHTVRHVMLPSQRRDEIAAEITESRKTLQTVTGQTVGAFAYPFGAFDSIAAAEARAGGFTIAVTCGDRPLPANAEILTLPRLDPCARGEEPFSAWLTRRLEIQTRDRAAVPASRREAAVPSQRARRRAIVAGWFSYTNSDYTAGDLLACELVREWLHEAGIESDVALTPSNPEGVPLDRVNPSDYSHAVFVCGPFAPAKLESEFLARFQACVTIGVNLSLPVPLAEWSPFHQLFERDSSRESHADIVFASSQPRVPVIGLCQVEAFGGADTRAANAALERLLASRQASVVTIDTRLDLNATGLRSSAEVESLLARMDAVVTTRLHGTVLSLKHGVPVVVIDPEPGGSRVLKQAQAIGWPMAFAVDAIDDETLGRALDYCLTPEARAKAAECKARADADVAGIRARFIAALTSPS